jgi:hypothetical protein
MLILWMLSLQRRPALYAVFFLSPSTQIVSNSRIKLISLLSHAKMNAWGNLYDRRTVVSRHSGTGSIPSSTNPGCLSKTMLATSQAAEGSCIAELQDPKYIIRTCTVRQDAAFVLRLTKCPLEPGVVH